ncbi:hypothetical protein IPM62_06055 [Candidatus Woesebacteria bacterium]|nr:MAG: hypothetical protein IPM62_06055 [Candidatus Woesebacteria bacterium]
MAGKELIRVNFKLPKSLADKFSRVAKNRGITKSELIREWILDCTELQLTKLSEKNNSWVSFDFLVDKKTENMIIDLAREFCVSKSAFLRLLLQKGVQKNIRFNVNRISNTSPCESIGDLWRGGKLLEIIHRVDEDIEKTDFSDLFWYTKANVELNNYEKAMCGINLIKTKYIDKDFNEYYYKKILLLEVEIEYVRRNFPLANNILKLVLSGNSLTNEIIGLAHYYYGSIAAITESPRKVLVDHYQIAQNNLTYSKNPYEITKMYVFSSYLQLRYENYKETDQILTNLSSCLLKNNNQYLSGWAMSAIGRLNSLRSTNTTAGSKILSDAFDIHRCNSYNRGMVESLALNAFNKFNQGNHQDAVKLIEKSLKNEVAFRNATSDGLTYSGLLFSMSRTNYPESMEKFRHVLTTSRSSHYTPKIYIYHAAQFLHADGHKEKEAGEIGLRKLMKLGKYPQIKTAARNTLKYKSLQPFAV